MYGTSGRCRKCATVSGLAIMPRGKLQLGAQWALVTRLPALLTRRLVVVKDPAFGRPAAHTSLNSCSQFFGGNPRTDGLHESKMRCGCAGSAREGLPSGRQCAVIPVQQGRARWRLARGIRPQGLHPVLAVVLAAGAQPHNFSRGVMELELATGHRPAPDGERFGHQRPWQPAGNQCEGGAAGSCGLTCELACRSRHGPRRFSRFERSSRASCPDRMRAKRSASHCSRPARSGAR